MTLIVNESHNRIATHIRKPIVAELLEGFGKTILLAMCLAFLTACQVDFDQNQETDSASEYAGGCGTAGCGTDTPTGPNGPDAPMGPDGSDTADEMTKTGDYEQDGDAITLADQEYAATETDQSGVYVFNSGQFTLDNSTISKTGDSSNVNQSNFYGLNAIVLAEDQSTITLTDSDLNSDAEGANGAFAYGEGSNIYLEGCTITTTQNSSRGVDATFGGSVTLSDTTISTQGDHSAALATDRGEGTITATNCTGTTSGQGPPGIYSTGTFNITGGSYTATGSEAAAIEGLNSITLTDAAISGAVKRGVMIYQSMSGDSTLGTGKFTMSGGSLTNNSDGPVFFICNTTGVIHLTSVEIVSNGDTFLAAEAPSEENSDTNPDWGDNGGTVTLTASNQTLSGDITCDEASSIAMTLSEASNISGTIDTNNEGDVSLTLEEESNWTATADSYLTALDGIVLSGSTPANIDAPSGSTIYCAAMSDTDGTALTDTYSLSSGGTLQLF